MHVSLSESLSSCLSVCCSITASRQIYFSLSLTLFLLLFKSFPPYLYIFHTISLYHCLNLFCVRVRRLVYMFVCRFVSVYLLFYHISISSFFTLMCRSFLILIFCPRLLLISTNASAYGSTLIFKFSFIFSYICRLTTEAAEQLFKKSRDRVYVTHVLTDEECACSTEEELDYDSMIISDNANSKKRPLDLTNSTQQQHSELPHRKKANKKSSELSAADRLKLSITSTIKSVRNDGSIILLHGRLCILKF